MEVIPVLDVLGGVAVHARGGDRRTYRPVESALADGADPLTLARAYRDRLGLRSCYVADLDAITGAPPNVDLVRALAAEGVQLWVDAGIRDAATARAVRDAGATRVVVGLETLPRLETLAELAAELDPASRVLSLDLWKERPLARDRSIPTQPVELASVAATMGFESLIILDLARVGSEGGAFDALLPPLRARCPDADLYLGGGVRDASELRRLAENGWSGALIATALHRGRIVAHELTLDGAGGH